MDIGKNIKMLRKMAGLTQARLAGILGVSRPAGVGRGVDPALQGAPSQHGRDSGAGLSGAGLAGGGGRQRLDPEQLIGATYQRNHYGPTPMEFGALVQAMSEQGELVCMQQPYFDFTQKKYLPLRDPDLSKLNAPELQLINDVIDRLSDMGARQISDYSHKDVPWATTLEGEVIPYEAVFYRSPEYSVRVYGEDGDDV